MRLVRRTDGATGTRFVVLFPVLFQSYGRQRVEGERDGNQPRRISRDLQCYISRETEKSSAILKYGLVLLRNTNSSFGIMRTHIGF